jgi:hypothetical protein
MTLFVDSKIINVYQGWNIGKSILYLIIWKNSIFQAKISDKQTVYNDIYQYLTAQSLFLGNLNQIWAGRTRCWWEGLSVFLNNELEFISAKMLVQ